MVFQVEFHRWYLAPTHSAGNVFSASLNTLQSQTEPTWECFCVAAGTVLTLVLLHLASRCKETKGQAD